MGVVGERREGKGRTGFTILGDLDPFVVFGVFLLED
jgi:hypothetical protein